MVSIIDGSQLVIDSETNLFDESGTLQHYATWIFLNPMVAADTYRIRVYVQDKLSAGTERKFVDETLIGVQDPVGFYIPYIPTDKYRVSMIRTAGTNRTFLWRRVELP